MQKLAIGAALGALLAFFFDPQGGARRRHTFRDRFFAFFRRRARETGRAGREVASEAYGLAQKARHRREEPKEYDDATLAQKVESEVFRDPDFPKGRINVNVQNGVVQLRGELPDPDLIEDLVSRTRDVQGVRDVENLLHTPGTPAPMHQ
jgi:osmotically-inducible protein OsmY